MAILILIIVTAIVLWRFQKGFWPGLCCGVGFLVSLPHEIQVSFAGSGSGLTVHRVIVLLTLGYWLKEQQSRALDRVVPFRALFFCILVTQSISLLFSRTFFSSLLEVCLYAFENVLYFVLVVTAVRDLNDVTRLVRAICIGLFGVALVAYIERHSGYSPMKYFPGYYEDTVMSTFAHRILLGTGMAMGWPLCMAWATAAPNAFQRAFAWLTALLCIAACYFAHSRGPWLGMVLVAGILAALGSSQQRRRLLLIAGLAVFVFAASAGVRDTIMSRAGSTFDDESEAQVSYQWRWELWYKAWKEITRSPVTAVVGYGPAASQTLNWEGEVATLEGFTSDSFSSWDNHWAAYLLDCGLLGFTVLLVFYVAMIARILTVWRRAEGGQKDIAALIFCALIVYTFMQTNVKIFAPQLNFIFWTALAAGLGLETAPASNLVAPDLQKSLEPGLESAPAGS